MVRNIIAISLLLSTAISVCGYDLRFDPIGADHAVYGVHHKTYGNLDPAKFTKYEDQDMYPRTFVHSIYKFGVCTPEMTQKVFLHKSTNITLTDWKSTLASYIYLLETENTIRFRIQCVVMKIMVPRKYLFLRGRIPIYYCQGILRYVYLLTYQKIEIHEWYLGQHLDMPSHLQFEFYHAPPYPNDYKY